ncbi:MAG: carbon starvation CstA family protein, partial [bacterium]
MGPILLMVLSFLGYIVVYHTYGRFLSRKVFAIRRETLVPSHEFKDGIDYVPTKKGIIFGHHFTSIAGTGPIVGPAIGIIWGWVPAFLWVFLGAIVMGAVHDYGSLIISLRNKGKSISEITSTYLNRRARMLFFLIVFFELLIVVAIFGLVIAIIFSL